MAPKKSAPNGARAPRAHRVIDAKRFVKEWTLCSSIHELAERMEIPTGTAYQFAKKLRDKGVPLKIYRRGENFDVAELTEIIKKTEADL